MDKNWMYLVLPERHLNAWQWSGWCICDVELFTLHFLISVELFFLSLLIFFSLLMP